jgi:glycosyltransferase involved in cell wall biosynthesis
MKANLLHDDARTLTVSVIIPAYNCAAYIQAAVDSALKQSRVPDEIIVVDDGSTDGTDRVLAKYEAPVRVIRQVNAGESAARNTGLRAARGDLIAFLDGDDTFTPDSIARRVEILEASPEVGVVYGDMYVMNAAGEPQGRHSDYMPGTKPSGYILPELALRCFILIPAMIRRSALGDQTFDESLHHCPDYDFWRKLAAHCQFRYTDEPVAHYRIHDANKIVMQPRSIQECELIVQQRIFAMPEFQQLSRRQKARAYRHHAAKSAVLGRSAVARKYLARSVWEFPFSLAGVGLLLLSLLGPRLLPWIILQRRKRVGNDLVRTASGQSGESPSAVRRRPASPPESRSPRTKPATARRGDTTKVLVVGQSPPPFGGQAIMIGRLVESKLDDVTLIHVRMNFSSHMNEVGRVRLSKVLHLFKLIAQIAYCRVAHRVRILYYPPSGPFRVPMYRDLVILLATRWMFSKTIFHFHAGGVSELYGRLSFLERWLFRLAYFGADAAVRISELNPDDGRLLEAKREYVIPCGIDDPCPEFLSPPAGEVATHSQPLRILFVGILRESKGMGVLVEACGKLADAGVPFRLEVMGQCQEPPFVARLHARIAELNLQDKIHFLGVLTGEEKFAAFARAEVFCMPTFFECETFGLVFVEAMAFGLPVVATRWRGVPSIVDEGETGFLVDIRDPSAVAERLTILADDPGLRERMGLAGREKFEREYIWQRHADRMRDLFLEVDGVAALPVRQPREEALAVH